MTADELQKRLEELHDRVAVLEARAEGTLASAAALMGSIRSEKKAAAARTNGASRWKNHAKQIIPS